MGQTSCRGRDRTVVGFTTTCAISAYHHLSCEFNPYSWRGVLGTTLCDKVCQWLAVVSPVSSTYKGNAKRGVSPRLKIRPCDLDLWPWESIGFQILLRSKYVPSLVKIHWRMLILECSQGCYTVKNLPSDLDRWPWKSIGFQTLLRTKYVPSLFKIHWRMLILECSQGCYAVKIWPGDLDNQ